MGHVFLNISNSNIAQQIADLLNKNNRLTRHHNTYTIQSSTVTYFVEIADNKVIGCAGIEKNEPGVYTIRHVCVHPNYRGMKIASKLISNIILLYPGMSMYMNIRSDNIPSLKMATSLNFAPDRAFWNKNRKILRFKRST